MANQFETAKRTAVARYLTVEQSNVFHVFGVSTAPRHNVVGVGIGPKLVDGNPTNQTAIRFYVERKVPEASLLTDNMLPKVVEGIPTDVIETGRFIAGAPAGAASVLEMPAAVVANPEREKIRPAQPGCSTGFQFTGNQAGIVMAGTLGAIVLVNGDVCLLSNNHVLANENDLPIGSPIFQPGLLDGGNPATDQIAALSAFVRIDPSVDNLVDCAVAKVLDPKLVSAVVFSKVGKLASATPLDPATNMEVEKDGRTTGYTQGTVMEVNATVKVEYAMGVVTFDDQIIVQGDGGGSFSAAGDSGSLIVERATKRAAALLFAGSGTHTIANKLANVLTALGASLVI